MLKKITFEVGMVIFTMLAIILMVFMGTYGFILIGYGILCGIWTFYCIGRERKAEKIINKYELPKSPVIYFEDIRGNRFPLDEKSEFWGTSQAHDLLNNSDEFTNISISGITIEFYFKDKPKMILLSEDLISDACQQGILELIKHDINDSWKKLKNEGKDE